MKIESLAANVANAQSIRAVNGSSAKRVPQQENFQQQGRGQNAVSNGGRSFENKVAPEEILDKIKEISEDGLYSVRFEKNDEIDQLVVKLVDRQTDEVIRQIPPEAILGVKANLQEYATGNIFHQMS
ncbi:flagellar protein FlaG [Desulfosalsimonas propionicica]|uniref:Flagellar protein FlaG n=1 Tax=Desulfosalsimonas propionicica TaxID=332175 RepID=A0A7W0HLT3_9BACT|nr:flagellar protein FlaG [Desulfosalsimonas propionicica]MBA2882664.1 flagellar protein FlaG [Desulfosalsimonas propionicica]